MTSEELLGEVDKQTPEINTTERIFLVPKPTQNNSGDKELYKIKEGGSGKKITRNVNNSQRRGIR
jgi:hypothetical protein